MSLILDIDHEAGDLSEYTSTVTDSGDLSAAAGAALAGTGYGLSCLIDDTNAIYGEADFTQLAADGWRFRVYIDPNTLTMASGNAFWFLALLYNTSSRLLMELRYDGANYGIRAELQDDGATWRRTSYYDITNAPHYVEVNVQRASSGVAGDGYMQLYIDGSLQETFSSIDLYDLAQPNRLRLGPSAGLDAGTSGTLLLDELILNNSHEEIGEVVTGVTVTPSPVTVELGGVDPSVVLGSLTITPSPATMELDGVDPTAVLGSLTITPAPATVELGGLDPTVTAVLAITPDPATMELAGVDPAVVLGSLAIGPAAATVELAGVDPDVVLGSLTITPTVVTVELVGVDPNVVLGGLTITPAPATVVLGPGPVIYVIGDDQTPEAVSIHAYVRCLVGDIAGRLIDELEVELEAVSWVLNDVGKTTIKIARTDPKATEVNLRPGNCILLQFTNGLPDWAGILDLPRKWSADGTIGMDAYSGEYLLSFRRAGRVRTFDGDTPGAILAALTREANARAATGIDPGTVWTGGIEISPTYERDPILEVVRDDLCGRLSKGDFYVVPAVENGIIRFTAQFDEQRGRRRPAVALVEDLNVADAELIEQGPLENVQYITGPSSSDDDYALEGTAEDLVSAGMYRLREGHESHTEAERQEELDEIAANRLDETTEIRPVVTLSALDRLPARFADYDVGDTIRVELPGYGFDGYDHMCRVVAREYDPAGGVCKLVLEENDG